MKKNALRFLASLLCATMLVCNDGVAAIAADIEEPALQEIESVWEDVTDEELPEITQETAVSENEITVSENEEEIIEESLFDDAVFTDELGYSFSYNTASPNEYIYNVVDGELVSVTNSDGTALSGDVVISDTKGIRSINASAFSKNNNITYVALPYGVETLGDGAFEECSSLKSVNIPKTVKVIGDKAFSKCSSLVQISIPKKVERIGKNAFSKDEKLYIVYMSDIDFSCLDTIDDYAFEGCKSLLYFCSDTKVDFPLSLRNIGDHAFDGCVSINSLPLSNKIESIGEYAFAKCENIKTVTIPDGLTALKKGTFAECGGIASIEMGRGKALQSIEAEAFKNCYNLGKLELGNRVKYIGDAAFAGCTNLVAVRFLQPSVTFGLNPFESPQDHVLYLIGSYSDDVENYCQGKTNIVYLEKEDEDSDSDKFKCIIPDEITGGALTAFLADEETDATVTGVTVGTTVYVTVTPKDGYELVPSSLKCNGNSLKLSDNKYTFTMPQGGAFVTAEFRLKTKEKKIAGTDFDISFSNGEVDANNSNMIKVKLGEKTSIILIDTYDGSVIPSEKISYSYVSSKDAEIVKTTTSGSVTPLKVGDAKIKVSVTGKNSQIITKTIIVSVSEAVLDNFILQATSYKSSVVTVDSDMSGIDTVYLNATDSAKANYEVSLKATAYDNEERTISVKLDWKTSDNSVAYVKEASTTNMQNTLVVPKGANGEATITVTAKVNATTTITKHFLVVVRDMHARISSSNITINPNMNVPGKVTFSQAYGVELAAPESIEIYEDQRLKEKHSELKMTYAGEVNGVYTYNVYTTTQNVKEGTYTAYIPTKLKLGGQVGDPYTYTVKVTVKKSVPNPKTAFVKNGYIELFNKVDSSGVELQLTGLGDAKIKDIVLKSEASDKDKCFENNFRIEQVGDKYYLYKNLDLLLPADKKPIVKGNLLITFEGYKDDITVTRTVTVPVKTTKPGLKFTSVSKTFNVMAKNQQVEISVLNSKTGKAIDLSDPANGNYSVSVLSGSVLTSSDEAVVENGKIVIKFGDYVTGGKVILRLTNDSWAPNQYFDYTYTVKTSKNNPKSSLSKSKVEVNVLSSDSISEFKLVSDQTDTNYFCSQTFEAKPTNAQKTEIDKLEVKYDPVTATGSVKIKDNTVKPGNYKFDCVVNRLVDGNELPTNKVSLTVAVVKANPTSTLKGNSIKLNQRYLNDEARMVLTWGTLPAGYTLDEDATKATLVCTTKNHEGLASKVDLSFREEVNAKNVIEQCVYASLNSTWVPGSYKLSFTPVYSNNDKSNSIAGKAVTITLKIDVQAISVSLGASGSINLANRIDPVDAINAYASEKKLIFTNKNSIIYNPSVKNYGRKIVGVEVRDSETGNVSDKFTATIIESKIYLTAIQGADIESGKQYKVKFFYTFDGGDTLLSADINVKPGQTLPGVTINTTSGNVYLSRRSESVSFVITPKSSEYALESVAFGEKDSNSINTYDISYAPLSDGSIKVTLKLKKSVAYKCDSTNTHDLYVRYVDQSTNTAGTKVSVKIKINR